MRIRGQIQTIHKVFVAFILNFKQSKQSNLITKIANAK